LNHFLLACSWGGYESLAFPVCAFTDTKDEYGYETPWNLVRIYIGLEDADELIADLKQALDKV
jgi:cystathionine beta-lyase/cystathionine gamma-synthase